MKTQDNNAAQNTIGLTEAQGWVNTWRAEESTYNSHSECNGFIIPLSDLKGLIAEMDSLPPSTVPNYVRAYIGIKTNNLVSPPTQTEKLILVATKPGGIVNGEQIYLDMITADNGKKYNGGGLIYDFTDPCPPRCDATSPLN